MIENHVQIDDFQPDPSFHERVDQIVFLRFFRKRFRNFHNYQEYYIRVRTSFFFGKIWNSLNILRAFRLVTRLMVYRALDIQKQSGHPMGGNRQRPSVLTRRMGVIRRMGVSHISKSNTEAGRAPDGWFG